MINGEVGLRFLIFWQVVGVIFIVAAFLVSLDPYPIRSSIQNLDKIFHATTYAGLAFWFMQLNVRRRHLWVAVAFIVMGVLIEYLQSFTRTRTPDVYDALANTVGVAIGWVIARTPAGRLLETIEGWITQGRN